MGDTDPKRKRTRADDLRFEGSDDDLELPMPDEPYEESYARRQMEAVAKQARVFAPTGDTDRLAELLDGWTTGPTASHVAARHLRSALADGSLTPEDLGMVVWCDICGDLPCDCPFKTYRLPSKEVTDG